VTRLAIRWGEDPSTVHPGYLLIRSGESDYFLETERVDILSDRIYLSISVPTGNDVTVARVVAHILERSAPARRPRILRVEFKLVTPSADELRQALVEHHRKTTGESLALPDGPLSPMGAGQTGARSTRYMPSALVTASRQAMKDVADGEVGGRPSDSGSMRSYRIVRWRSVLIVCGVIVGIVLLLLGGALLVEWTFGR